MRNTHFCFVVLIVAGFALAPGYARCQEAIGEKDDSIFISQYRPSFTPAADQVSVPGEFSANNSIDVAGAIELYYNTILARPSDSEGKAYWINQANNGMSLAAIESEFYKSAEFQTNFANLTAPAPGNIAYSVTTTQNTITASTTVPTLKTPPKGYTFDKATAFISYEPYGLPGTVRTIDPKAQPKEYNDAINSMLGTLNGLLSSHEKTPRFTERQVRFIYNRASELMVAQASSR